jgi:hypothetical protein
MVVIKGTDVTAGSNRRRSAMSVRNAPSPLAQSDTSWRARGREMGPGGKRGAGVSGGVREGRADSCRAIRAAGVPPAAVLLQAAETT